MSSNASSNGSGTNNLKNTGASNSSSSNKNAKQNSNGKKWYQNKFVLWSIGLVVAFAVGAIVFAPTSEDGEAPTMKDRLVQGSIFAGVYLLVALVILLRINVFLLQLMRPS